MYKLPIKSPKKPFMTQPYGDKSNAAWYKAQGLNLTEHNGQDYITGTPVETYGTELVCPFPTAKVVKVVFDTPMATKGNGVTLEYKEGKNRLQIVLWHTGEVKAKLGDELKEGDVVCYIGNSGLCRPAPSAERPYDGSHLHFMLYINGVLKDPATAFDSNSWYKGKGTDSQHDIEPLKWSWGLRGVTDWWIKMIEAFKFWN